MNATSKPESIDAAGIAPAYTRHYAKGSLKLTVGSTTEESHGDMICEHNYMGRKGPRAGVQRRPGTA